ncbi:gigasin-6-like [Dreissena polymorpha]|uniref:gigasin-6-like n=1 Tax=Dreissena polymorpha TaxID=45954 RepID=UPI0022656CED|nr:gigasin-6-like [Dreissena polymorpha]
MVKQLRDRKLSLHTKPSDLLPEGFQFSAREFTQYAIIHDLMTHYLGVPPNQMMRLDKTLTRKKAARRIRYFRPVHKFRLKYLYSNMHYGIVSYLSEVLGGKSWENLIRENFFVPLGMIHSDFLSYVNQTAYDVAHGYVEDALNGELIQVSEELNKYGIFRSYCDMFVKILRIKDQHCCMYWLVKHTMTTSSRSCKYTTIQRYRLMTGRMPKGSD